MYHQLSEIKNLHKGADIYIIGSGASMNYVDKSFFDNKLSVGINFAHRHYKCKYSVIKDIVTRRDMAQHLSECKRDNSLMITTSAHMGGTHLYNTKYNYFVFKEDQWGGFVRAEYVGTETIVNSHSTVTTAMHVAFYLGAANIILCGIDCGLIDGKSNHDLYYPNVKPEGIEYQKKSMSHPYHEWNIKQMRTALKKHDCNVYSLNPFINLGLEGHKFTKLETPAYDLWAGERK